MKKKLKFDPFSAWGCCTITFLIFCLLQIWRHHFYLTDDSFTFIYPIWVEIGRAIFDGQNPFISNYIFEGDYNLYGDSMFSVLWHPVPFLLSLLAVTPLHSFMVDLYALFNLLLCSLGFYRFLNVLLETYDFDLPPLLQLLIPQSFIFSMFGLLLGSSGFWYLCNMAALPWMVLPLYQKKILPAIIIGTLALYHNATAGYPSCFIYSTLLISFVALWRSAQLRSFQPSLIWLISGCLAGILALPTHLGSMLALSDSVRGGAIPLEAAVEFRMPLQVIAVSFFLGPVSSILGEYELFGFKLHAYALASSIAAPLLIISFFYFLKWKVMDWCWITMIILSALLVARPNWLASIIHHIPILNALRWPHKEMYLILFFSHLLMIYAGTIPRQRAYQAAFLGTCIFLAFLLPFQPPSLGSQRDSRALYFSGKAHEHWKQIKEIQGDRDYILPIIDQSIAKDIMATISLPDILTGTHNFSALFRVRSWSGYSGTLPSGMYERIPNLWPLHLTGGYVARDFNQLSEINHAAIIWTKSADPLDIRMQSESGEWVKLKAD